MEKLKAMKDEEVILSAIGSRSKSAEQTSKFSG
jgi:hypothetical protein